MIDEYFRALAETMARESELMGRLYAHRGKLGENREQLVTRFLNTYLPACYAVSSGFVLLGGEERSTQQDVVVYERLTNPVLFPDSAAPLFPPSALAASIEVKSQLTKRELQSAAEKSWRLKQELRRSFVHHPRPPEREALTALFAFRSPLEPAALLALMREYEQRSGVEVRDRIDLVCVLNVGVVVAGSLWSDALRGQRPELADVEAIAVDVEASLFVFYTRLIDFLARRRPTPAQLMSYLPPASPMGIVVGTG